MITWIHKMIIAKVCGWEYERLLLMDLRGMQFVDKKRADKYQPF